MRVSALMSARAWAVVAWRLAWVCSTLASRPAERASKVSVKRPRVASKPVCSALLVASWRERALVQVSATVVTALPKRLARASSWVSTLLARPSWRPRVSAWMSARAWAVVAWRLAWVFSTLARRPAERASKESVKRPRVASRPVCRALLAASWRARALVQVSATVVTVLSKRPARPSSWAATVSVRVSRRLLVSRAMPAMVASTTGWIASPARRALWLRLSRRDWSTEAASAV